MVICLNEAERIGRCLETLSFCDEVVVIDSGSTDGTLDIVRASGAKLIERPFVSWNDQKDFGRSQCAGDWVLNIDADEEVTAELRDEITRTLTSAPDSIAAYRMPFRNHLRDAWIKSCGFYPDRHVRLVRRERAHWDTNAVHDRVFPDGDIGTLQGHIDHYSFASIADYVEKSCIYAEAFARDGLARGKTVGLWTIFIHTFGRLVKSLLLQGGLLDGMLGWTMAGLQTAGTFQKYARLWEMQRFASARPDARPEATPRTLGDPWRDVRVTTAKADGSCSDDATTATAPDAPESDPR